MTKMEVGYFYLGPILRRFCHLLNEELAQFPLHETTVLWVSRGGFRIRHLMDLYSKGSIPHQVGFRISRAAVARACYAVIPSHVEQALKDSPTITTFMEGADQEWVLLREYVKESCGERRIALMVDTGTRGTSQGLLGAAFPEYDWHGRYFYLNNYSNRRIVPPWFAQSKGLWINRDHRSMIPYWHLLEDTLEAQIPSVSTFADLAFSTDGIYPATGSMFDGVCRYFQSRTAIDPEWSYRELRRKILYPTNQDVDDLMVGERDGWPIIIHKGNLIQRLLYGLWPQAQCRVEFGPVAPIPQFVMNLHGKVTGKW